VGDAGALTVRQATLVIRNQQGMHARACQVFVRTASRFRSKIVVARDDLEVDGKSILGVLMLAAEPGAEIHIRTEGVDESEALEAMRQIVEDKFGEE
jgi:phosphocarrier protein HPr